jgi:hypothetical protein
MATTPENGEGGGRASGDEAVGILRDIWQEMKALNARIDRTREDLGSRLD